MPPKGSTKRKSESEEPEAPVKTAAAKKIKPSDQLDGIDWRDAEDLKVVIHAPGPDGSKHELVAEPTTFTSGSFGWKVSGAITVNVISGGKTYEVKTNLSGNFTVPGSKPKAKKGKAAPKKKKGDESEEEQEEDDEEEVVEEEKPKKAPAKSKKATKSN